MQTIIIAGLRGALALAILVCVTIPANFALLLSVHIFRDHESTREIFEDFALTLLGLAQWVSRLSIVAPRALNVPPPKSNQTILLSNHVTYMDWVVLCIMAHCQFGALDRIKYVAKDSVRHVPLLGPMMRAMKMLFVKRQKNGVDQKNMVAQLRHFAKRPVCYAIFPEGTLIDGHSAKDHALIESRIKLTPPGQEPLTHVLEPRLGGLTLLREHLSRAPVWDISLAFENYDSDGWTNVPLADPDRRVPSFLEFWFAPKKSTRVFMQSNRFTNLDEYLDHATSGVEIALAAHRRMAECEQRLKQMHQEGDDSEKFWGIGFWEWFGTVCSLLGQGASAFLATWFVLDLIVPAGWSTLAAILFAVFLQFV